MSQLEKKRQLLEQQKRIQAELAQLDVVDPIGTWEVTTEKNVDGGTKILGKFTGHVFDIAKHLKDQANPTLSFKRTEGTGITVGEGSKREVSIIVQDEGIPYADKEKQLEKLSPYLRNGEKLEKGLYFGSIKLSW